MKLIVALAAAAALLPAVALAHGVSLDVERRGPEVSVRARYAGGRPLAGATYEVRAPGPARGAGATGRTDADGRLVFVADAAGTWTVRVVDATGHGGTARVKVEAAELAQAGVEATSTPTPTPASTPTSPPTSTSTSTETPDHTHASPLARGALGVAGIGLVFGVLFVVQRRRARG